MGWVVKCYLLQKTVFAVFFLSNKYQQELSLPVCGLSSIHFTLPTVTIFSHQGMYGIACFVCIQSASNKSQVGRWLQKCSIIGWRSHRDQGGFVMIKSICLYCISKASAFVKRQPAKSDNDSCGSISVIDTHCPPLNFSICDTNLPSPAHGSAKVNFFGRCRISGSTAFIGVG